MESEDVGCRREPRLAAYGEDPATGGKWYVMKASPNTPDPVVPEGAPDWVAAQLPHCLKLKRRAQRSWDTRLERMAQRSNVRRAARHQRFIVAAVGARPRATRRIRRISVRRRARAPGREPAEPHPLAAFLRAVRLLTGRRS